MTVVSSKLRLDREQMLKYNRLLSPPVKPIPYLKRPLTGISGKTAKEFKIDPSEVDASKHKIDHIKTNMLLPSEYGFRRTLKAKFTQTLMKDEEVRKQKILK